MAEIGEDPARASRLAEDARRLHRSLIEAVLASGSVPSARELAARLATTEDNVRSGLAALAAADYVALDTSGQISCLYPFSTTPTSHAVIMDGKRRFAMCAIDALGIPAMLGQSVDVTSRCAVCDASISLRVAPGEIVAATPPQAMVVAHRDEAEPAFAACCPFTVFACGPEHGDQFMSQVAGTHRLPLHEALPRAEEIFGSLLADSLPATRPRGKQWRRSGDG